MDHGGGTGPRRRRALSVPVPVSLALVLVFAGPPLIRGLSLDYRALATSLRGDLLVNTGAKQGTPALPTHGGG